MSTRSNFFVFSALSIVALATVACGKPGSKSKDATGTATLTSATAPKGGSCVQEKAGVCEEYKDNMLGLAESSCKDLMKGTYSKDACPQANLMATCERKNDKKYYYYGGSFPWLSDAKDSCEKDGLEPGKLTAQPNAEQTAKDKALPTTATIQGSCTKQGGSCEDLYGEMFDLQKSTCEQFDGKFSSTPCSAEKLVGSCVKNGKTERLYEKDLKFSKMSELQENCEKYAIPFGHFYPGPNAPAPKAAPGAKGKGGAAKSSGGGAAKAKQK